MTAIDRMYEAMEWRQKSPADMARGLNISTSRFGNWKSRGSIPKEMLEPVSLVLDINLEWLMTGKGDPLASPLLKRNKQRLKGLGNFQEIVRAMEISVLGYNPPEMLHSIFHASMDHFLRTPEGRKCFSDYLARLLANRLGVRSSDAQIRDAVEKSIDEVLDRRDHHGMPSMVAEPEKKY